MATERAKILMPFRHSIKSLRNLVFIVACCSSFVLCGTGCFSLSGQGGDMGEQQIEQSEQRVSSSLPVHDIAQGIPGEEVSPGENPTNTQVFSEDKARDVLNLTEDYRMSFVHGKKEVAHQKYIMLHDTEGDAEASSVIDWWDSNGNMVAAHFIINKDGSITQCAPLDAIVHHAGFGDSGHNKSFGVEDESRDDMIGTVPIGDWAADYGMNSYSVGIELVHVGGSGDYPREQLDALDLLIAYLDAYYGFESKIIDHKAWRSGNSDTSPEFSIYLESYQTIRSYHL